MKMSTLASRIAKAEGKKVEVSIGNIREILKVIVKMEVDAQTSDESPLTSMVNEASALMAKLAEKAKKKSAKKK